MSAPLRPQSAPLLAPEEQGDMDALIRRLRERLLSREWWLFVGGELIALIAWQMTLLLMIRPDAVLQTAVFDIIDQTQTPPQRTTVPLLLLWKPDWPKEIVALLLHEAGMPADVTAKLGEHDVIFPSTPEGEYVAAQMVAMLGPGLGTAVPHG